MGKMAKVGFFTAVSFGDQPKSRTQSLLETVDSYFYLGGKKAYVIPGHTQQDGVSTILTKDSPAFLITVLKVISYLTVAIPVILLIAKAILRSIHNFHIIDAKQKLEEGIDISQATIEKIQMLMPKIQGRQDDVEITWHARSNNLVFSLTTVPNLIFKMAPAGGVLSAEQISEQRFANMIKAKEVCLTHQLSLLVIPHAKKFNVAGMTLIAEERVNINQNESAQEHLYQLSGLNETARQQATFIAKTDFSDMEWRNMPVIDAAPEFQGNRRVALVDLEEMDGAVTGIFGGFRRRGLVRCLHSEAQIDIVLAEAQRQGVRSRYSSPAEQVKARRMEEIQADHQLQQFYMRNGILENARKPIQVDDLASLDLDLEEQGSIRTWRRLRTGTDGNDWGQETISITLGQAVTDVIAQINEAIAQTPENASVKGKRYILLNTANNGSLQDYHRLGLPDNQVIVTREDEQQIWLRRIINALVAKGHLFKLVEVDGRGYCIQA